MINVTVSKSELRRAVGTNEPAHSVSRITGVRSHPGGAMAIVPQQIAKQRTMEQESTGSTTDTFGLGKLGQVPVVNADGAPPQLSYLYSVTPG